MQSDSRPRAMPSVSTTLKPPGPLLLLLEGRAPWEFAATLASAPLFRRFPAGDGHPVIVFPGLGVSDITTLPLRLFLRERGYAVVPWGQGMNLGPREGVIEACRALVQQTAERHGGPVSLLGWSLGGVYARELAKEMPSLVRGVITLGSPFSGHPHATNAWRVFRFVSGRELPEPEVLAQLREVPPVPTTSMYSRTDGIVAWQCSLNDDHPHAENIHVPASHFGMGMNPFVFYAIADRLAQAPGQWRRFDAEGLRRFFFRTTLEAA